MGTKMGSDMCFLDNLNLSFHWGIRGDFGRREALSKSWGKRLRIVPISGVRIVFVSN